MGDTTAPTKGDQRTAALVCSDAPSSTPSQAPVGAPLLVEFVGLAGTGKSTLLAELQRRDPGIVTLQRARTRRHAHAVALDAVRFAPAFAASLLTAPRFSWRSARYYLRLEALRRVAKEVLVDTPGTLVLEHGPVFTLARIMAFGGGGAPPTTLQRYADRSLARWMAILDLIVVLDAARPELIRRIRQRAKAHGMRHHPDGIVHGFLNRYDVAYAGILRHVAAATSPPIVSLRTDQLPLPTLADQVQAALAEARRAT